MTISPSGRLAAALLAGCATALGLLAGASAQTARFDGVSINVLTFTGPVIAEPLQRRAPEFEALTGADVNIITVPFADLYTKILTDLSTGTNSIDAAVFAPQWLVDFAAPGYLLPLDDRIAADPAIQWDDVGPFFRDFSATYDGKTYTIPFDGDFLMAYYRTDLFDAAGLTPPKTWDEYVAIAKQFDGQDLNGDGTPDYGACMTMKRSAQAYWMISNIAAPYIQAKGTSEGIFFSLEDMTPLVNNAAIRRAMEIYKELVEVGPPEQLNNDIGDARALFMGGRCALSIDWGDTGTLAIDKSYSSVIDKVGAFITPGSTQILDRATGELVDCTAELCPYATDGVNHAPFSAFGGWSGAVNAATTPEKQDAAYAFLSYMEQPAQANVDVTIGASGFNPYRISQFQDLAPWVAAGFSEAFAKNYLGAVQESLNSPNMALDLRIPFNQRYQQVALDLIIHQMASGELTIDEAMEQLEANWEEVTDEIGRDEQLAAYKATLGVTR